MGLTYLVCATERSGSTLLCESLAATGVAGCPAEYFEALRETGLPRQPREYLSALPDPSRGGRLPALEVDGAGRDTSGEALLERARREGTTDNGVFGAKMMWGYLDDFLERFGPLETPRNAARRRRLETLLPGVRYVRVVRRDKVRQAISLWKAIQTASWRAEEEGAAREPVYDRDAIEALVRRLFEHEQGWQRFFEGERIETLELTYESFSERHEETVRGVLDWLGIEHPPGLAVPDPPLRRQADERSEDWWARFTSGGSRFSGMTPERDLPEPTPDELRETALSEGVMAREDETDPDFEDPRDPEDVPPPEVG
jgi:trehalose 2-sulfotransferase